MLPDKTIDDIFNLINRVRSNPGQFIEKYSSLTKQYNGKIFKDRIKTRQGVAALNDLFSELKTKQKIVKPLKWSFALHMIADEQAKILGKYGLLTTEDSQYHAILPERAKQYGVIKGKISEVYEFGGKTGDQIIQWLLIDDGLISRKRRATLLDPLFNYIGIGCSYHSTQGTITVITLAQDISSFVAPGQDGYYIKRQPRYSQIAKVFKVQEKRINKPRTVEKEEAIYNSVDKEMTARPVANLILNFLDNK